MWHGVGRAQMATLRQVQWLGAGAGSFLTGVSDLVLAGSGDAVRLYSASRFATVTGGLSAFAVGGDGQVTGLNALALPTVPQSYGPTRLALVPGWPSGGGMLLAAGGAAVGPGGHGGAGGRAARQAHDGASGRVGA